MENKQTQWGSKYGFIMAACGAAIGLGNLWRMPYLIGTHGGGAFLLIFLFFFFVLGKTVLLAEAALGRNSQKSAIKTYSNFGKKTSWIGYLIVLGTIMISAFYFVVGGWIIKYLVSSFTFNAAENTQVYFDNLTSSTWPPILFTIIFLSITALIVTLGVNNGIEKSSKIMMPILFVSIIIITIRCLMLPGAIEGLKFLFIPDFSKINSQAVLDAMGQVFFILSIGIGGMLTYSSYLSKEKDLVASMDIVAYSDLAVGIIAAIAFIPALFSFGYSPEQGPSLVFVTLPKIFASIPFGNIFMAIFFFLFFFAALTPAINMYEIIVSCITQKCNISRRLASSIIFVVIGVLTTVTSLSFGVLSGVKIFGMSIFDFFNYTASNIIMPICALAACIVVGYIWKPENAKEELELGKKRKFSAYPLWKVCIKYVAPILIIAIFVDSIVHR